MSENPSGPTIADRYLRSIGLGVGAVMVGVVAYPIVAGLILAGAVAEAAASSDDYSNGGSGIAPLFYILAVVIGLGAVVAVLGLAWQSLAALSHAGRAYWSASGASPGYRGAASTGHGAAAAGRPLIVLSDADKAALRGVQPPGAAGWYADPLGRAGARWWNGTEWTGHVHVTGSVAPPLNAAEDPL